MFRTFTRTWWKKNPRWPNGLEPHAGRKTFYGKYFSEGEAREACGKYNSAHKPGQLSRKMEYARA